MPLVLDRRDEILRPFYQRIAQDDEKEPKLNKLKGGPLKQPS